MNFEKPSAPGHCLKILNDTMRTDILRSVHECIELFKEKTGNQSPLEILISSIEGVLFTYEKACLYESVNQNPFNANQLNEFNPEQDYKHDIKLLNFQLNELKKTLKEIQE